MAVLQHNIFVQALKTVRTVAQVWIAFDSKHFNAVETKTLLLMIKHENNVTFAPL